MKIQYGMAKNKLHRIIHDTRYLKNQGKLNSMLLAGYIYTHTFFFFKIKEHKTVLAMIGRRVREGKNIQVNAKCFTS